MNIPEFLWQYFWDVDPEGLRLREDGRFIIERILENGDDAAVRWLRENYDEGEMAEVVSVSRRLSLKSRHYWGLIFHLWSTINQSEAKPGEIWAR